MSTPHTDERFPQDDLDPPLDEVVDRLFDAHGRPDPDSGDDLLGSLIATILSQSTNNKNSSRAFGDLVDRFGGDWSRIAQADVDEIADAIEIGGLSQQKAPRIKKALQKIHDDFGAYSLEDLREWDVDEAQNYLLDLKGVGPKTASFVLMRAAEMPLFAMDTHILRLCKRLGWIDASTSSKKAHDTMLPHIPEGDHDAIHVVMIRHGRRVCHARNPDCGDCALLSLCDYGQTHHDDS